MLKLVRILRLLEPRRLFAKSGFTLYT